jgi:type II secretory pathway predicted ATPase ExeA
MVKGEATEQDYKHLSGNVLTQLKKFLHLDSRFFHTLSKVCADEARVINQLTRQKFNKKEN